MLSTGAGVEQTRKVGLFEQRVSRSGIGKNFGAGSEVDERMGGESSYLAWNCEPARRAPTVMPSLPPEPPAPKLHRPVWVASPSARSTNRSHPPPRTARVRLTSLASGMLVASFCTATLGADDLKT